MAIDVTKRPYEYNFSGNPVYYQLHSAAAAADNTISIEIRVRFKAISDSDYTDLVDLPFDPVDGYVDIDLKEILDGVLEYQLPAFPGNEKTIQAAPKQSGNFYIQFRETTVANPNGTWNDIELNHARFILKGGLNDFKYAGNNFWVNYFQVKQPFLTWQLSGRLAAYKERMYLGYLVDDDIMIGELKAMVKVYYTDGSIEVLSNNFAVEKGLVYYIPAGAIQWALNIPQPAKIIHYWTVQVWDYSDPDVPVSKSEVFKYELDNRNDYIDITLHYRNSLGCLDSLRVRGTVEKKIDYDFTEVEKAIRPDYWDGHYFQPQKSIYNNTEQLTWSGNLGPLRKEEQDRLRDAQTIRETWWERNKKWWPVVITTKNLTLNKSDDQRFSMPIEFTLAYAGSEYYTPDKMDLGEGVLESNVCMAYLSPITYIVDLTNGGANDGNAKVTVSFTEVDPENAASNFKYRVVNGATQVIAWTTKAIASGNPFSFVVPKDIVYTLETQAICGDGVSGKTVTSAIDTTSAAPEEPVPVELTNTRIKNNSSVTTVCKVYINGLLVNTSVLGSYNEKYINLDPMFDATVVLNLSSLFAASATLDGVPALISGYSLEWQHVTKSSGFTIEID
jgi:hypothetical protein